MIRAMVRQRVVWVTPVAVLVAAVSILVDVGMAGSAPAQDSVLDGVFTAAQATRGERIFERVCSTCHDIGEFSGGRFRLSWVGRSAGDLFDTMVASMPEDDPGSLSPDEYVSLVAYLFRLNGYPSGMAPLPADEMVLQTVQIEESNK